MKSKLNNLFGKLGLALVCGTFFQPAAALGQSEDTAKVASLIEKLSNWGRWGEDAEAAERRAQRREAFLAAMDFAIAARSA